MHFASRHGDQIGKKSFSTQNVLQVNVSPPSISPLPSDATDAIAASVACFGRRPAVHLSIVACFFGDVIYIPGLIEHSLIGSVVLSQRQFRMEISHA